MLNQSAKNKIAEMLWFMAVIFIAGLGIYSYFAEKKVSAAEKDRIFVGCMEQTLNACLSENGKPLDTVTADKCMKKILKTPKWLAANEICKNKAGLQ